MMKSWLDEIILVMKGREAITEKYNPKIEI